jgi:undecaprenyl-diphosphatase
MVIGRSRPEVETLHSVPSTSSFPSGHVAGALVLYGSLTLVARAISHSGRVPRSTWILPVVAVLIVASSRVYEGVHFPTDVVAGLVLGLGALVGAGWATGFLTPPDRPTAEASLGRR